MGPLSRRELLQFSAALAAAGLAGGTGFAETKTSAVAKRQEGPIRIAVIGVRGRGREHVAGFLAQKDAIITTICDCDSSVIAPVMQSIEKKNGKAPKFEKDLRKVFEDKDIDAVSIATPNHWHALAAIWAMQAGKDVYVEKPVSHNVSEGRRIVEVARKEKRICQTGTQIRSNPGMRDAIAFLKSGEFGKVSLARGLCYKPRGSIGKVKKAMPIPGTLDYDLWSGPAQIKDVMREKLHYDWHWIWDYGNGDLGNQGIHQMDVARWGLGQSGIANSVFSVGGRFAYVDDGETANTQMAVFEYGPTKLVFEVRGLGTPDFVADVRGKETADKKMIAKVGNVFTTDKGYLICSNYDSAVAVTKDFEIVKTFQKSGDHFANFLQAVKSRDSSELNGDIEEGHLSSALCHLANISYRLGEEHRLADAVSGTNDADALETLKRMQAHLIANKVDLKTTKCLVGPKLIMDPKTETFTGNAKANLMLTREYRKNYEVPAKV